MNVSIPGGKPLHEPLRACWSFFWHCISFNPRREAPPRATLFGFFCSVFVSSVSIPGGKPLHEPRHSTKASPSAHVVVSIPGGMPLHAPLGVTVRTPNQRSVSIPGGKPLHEPHDLREASNRSTSLFQSLAGSPSTSHTIVSDRLTFSLLCFNPWREAPPRATPACQYSQRQTPEFQSQAGSPSTSHHVRQQVGLITIVVSIPGGKPLHEPRKTRRAIELAKISFNPWREAPPRATHQAYLNDVLIMTVFQSLAGSPSTSHRTFARSPSLSMKVSIPGGKPLHEPQERLHRFHQDCESFNPWREAPPRATVQVCMPLPSSIKFQSLAGSPSTSHLL